MFCMTGIALHANFGEIGRNFIDLYKPKEAWVVNLGLRKEIKIDRTTVKFIPFFELV